MGESQSIFNLQSEFVICGQPSNGYLPNAQAVKRSRCSFHSAVDMRPHRGLRSFDIPQF